MGANRIHCDEHGEAYTCVICQHLLEGNVAGFFCNEDEPDEQWPTAWCADCERYIASVTDWENEEFWRRLRVVCHRCYERIRDSQLGK